MGLNKEKVNDGSQKGDEARVTRKILEFRT